MYLPNKPYMVIGEDIFFQLVFEAKFEQKVNR